MTRQLSNFDQNAEKRSCKLFPLRSNRIVIVLINLRVTSGFNKQRAAARLQECRLETNPDHGGGHPKV
jgi:hypothetical protein